jgi:hypothetical protein
MLRTCYREERRVITVHTKLVSIYLLQQMSDRQRRFSWSHTCHNVEKNLA